MTRHFGRFIAADPARMLFASIAVLLAASSLAHAKIKVTTETMIDTAPQRAGAAVAVLNDAAGNPWLIVAGGLDTKGRPIDRIDAMPLASADPDRAITGRLPTGLADSVNVQVGDELWCLGGHDSSETYHTVKAIKLAGDLTNARLELREPAALPDGATPLAAVVMDGQVHCLVRVDAPTADAAAVLRILTPPNPDRPEQLTWEIVDETDDPALTARLAEAVSVHAAVRYDDRTQRSVIHVIANHADDVRGDDPMTPVVHVRWHSPASPAHGWEDRAAPDAAIRSIAPFGASHILAQTDEGLLLYHTFTDTWVTMIGGDEFSHGRLMASPGGAMYRYRALPTGGAAVGRLDVASALPGFGWVNYAVIVVYLLGLMWIGGYFANREKTTEDYFLGGRKVPWWAAGISIYATGVSAISFMAIPAKTYATDWTYISQGILPPIVTFIAAYLFVPMLRRLSITTVMEYKGMRFGPSLRYAASFLLIAAQISGRMSVVLLLPALALSAVTGVDTITAVLLMGVIATIYTVLGGIHAVIWTDVLQVAVMFGGAILSLVIILLGADDGAFHALSVAHEFGKFRSFDWTWDFTTATVWVFTIWGIADLFNRVGQESMQRAFATKGIKEARRSLITCALISVPGTIIFYALGSALFAHYHAHPEQLDPTLATDATFPLFIATNLPIGLAGLVIAGLFAASMSTLDSGMNTVATVFVTDYYRLRDRDAPETQRLRLARWLTILSGAAGTGMAVLLAALDQRSLWDTFTIIMGLIGGGFGGVMVLGMMTRRANTIGTWVGIIAGTAAVAYVKFRTPTSFFIYGAIGMGVCILVGYVASLLTGGETKDLTGLTIWTPRREFVEADDDHGADRRS